MHIFGMGTAEIVVILFIVLLLFGPKNLPKLGRSIGKTIRAVKEGVQEGKDDVKSQRAVHAAAGCEGEGVQGPVGAARQKETALEAIRKAGYEGGVEPNVGKEPAVPEKTVVDAGHGREGVRGLAGAERQKVSGVEARRGAGYEGGVERETAYSAADGMGVGRKRPCREAGMLPGGQKLIESATGTGCDALAAMKSV